MLAKSLVNFTSPILRYIAFAVLVLLAIKFIAEKVKSELEAQYGHFHDIDGEIEHEHEHYLEQLEGRSHIHPHLNPKRVNLSLWKITSCAFFLGFAH